MELTIEQIIKALECCASEKYICTQCPIDEKIKEDCECGKVVARNALTLIKELTEENEKLTINMNAYGLTAKNLAEENEKLSKRISDMIENTEKLNEAFPEMIDEFEADIVKEFAEKIKRRFANDTDKIYSGYKIHAWVDRKVKEMLKNNQKCD